jgi:hypothetical protein
VLAGLCDIFDRYNEFVAIYENVIRNKNYAKLNKLTEYTIYSSEVEQGKKFKRKFEDALLKEINILSEDFNDSIFVILKDFKELVLKCNLDVSINFIKEINYLESEGYPSYFDSRNNSSEQSKICN